MTSSRIYGPHNLTSSSLCFRTVSSGPGVSETDSAEMYQDCRAARINFFDTAYVYTDGKSEQILGRLIASLNAFRSFW